ncbi:MAG: hypothetical protein LBG80_18755 [Bacteroidales bacterium]|jgi:predicted amino acid-binding ACT domain protein|nr:hypothetical protein [Bacteroidales bacterium]
MLNAMFPFNYLLTQIENVLKINDYPYERLNGGEGFKVDPGDGFMLWVFFNRQDESLYFIAKMMYSFPLGILQTVRDNIERVNAQISDGHFEIIHDHLSFVLVKEIKNLTPDHTPDHTTLKDWIDFPITQLSQQVFKVQNIDIRSLSAIKIDQN